MAIFDSKPIPHLTHAQVQRFHESYTSGGTDECWLWNKQFGKDGYGRFSVCIHGASIRRGLGAHRVAIWLATGEDPSGFVVMHRCDVRSCVNPSHLAMGSVADNVADRGIKGRTATGERSATIKYPGLRAGERHGQAKLSWVKVAKIRQRALDGEKVPRLAVEFGVTKATMYKIIHGDLWQLRHAPEGYPFTFTESGCHSHPSRCPQPA